MPAAATTGTSAARAAWGTLLTMMPQMRTRIWDACAEFDLTPMQGHLLRVLGPQRAVPMSELAGELFCDASNVTGIVDRLEVRGLVVRGTAEGDRRVRTIAMTPEGERLWARVADRIAEPPPGFTALSDADQRRLRDLLARALG